MRDVSEGGRESKGWLKILLNCRERRDEGRGGRGSSNCSRIVNDLRVFGRFQEMSKWFCKRRDKREGGQVRGPRNT